MRTITETVDLLQEIVDRQNNVLKINDQLLVLKDGMIAIQKKEITSLKICNNVLGVIILITVLIEGGRLICSLYNL